MVWLEKLLMLSPLMVFGILIFGLIVILFLFGGSTNAIPILKYYIVFAIAVYVFYLMMLEMVQPGIITDLYHYVRGVIPV
jgi:uncharacterized protein (DUF983 family)